MTQDGQGMIAMAKGRPKTGKEIVSVIHIRADRRWKDWFRAFCKRERLSGPGLIDRALTEMAKRKGFEPPPER